MDELIDSNVWCGSARRKPSDSHSIHIKKLVDKYCLRTSSVLISSVVKTVYLYHEVLRTVPLFRCSADVDAVTDHDAVACMCSVKDVLMWYVRGSKFCGGK